MQKIASGKSTPLRLNFFTPSGDARGRYLDSSLVAAFAALGSLSLNQQPLQRLDRQKPKWEASLRD
jgi:hypothetical protein